MKGKQDIPVQEERGDTPMRWTTVGNGTVEKSAFLVCLRVPFFKFSF